jgi:hypothetical protein
MGRYRKIETKTWNDAKFQGLSPIPPCGQGLWLFLLTGPFTGPIPGLFKAGKAAMAEELGWSAEAFEEAFTEVLSKGLIKFDPKTRLVWVVKAINHNLPESPNVVLSWTDHLRELPECQLMNEALTSIYKTICEHGEAFGKAFGKALGKDMTESGTGTGTGTGVIKETPLPSFSPPFAAETSEPEDAVTTAVRVIPFRMQPSSQADELFSGIRNAFQSRNPSWAKPDQQVLAIERLCALLRQIHPADPMSGANHVISAYLSLTETTDKFWGRQPFTPAGLLSLWDRVIKQLRQSVGDVEPEWMRGMV